MRDIEELRARVVLGTSRKYVDEVVAAYGAAAYRSAILALWVAVAADIIEKVHILVSHGEPAAIAVKTELDRATAAGPRALMNFERELLVTARDKLQLIDKREWQELDRLHEDRHLCAHPAFIRQDELFSPGPELVRAHLAAAIDNLLGHGPVTGRRAVERFEREIGGVSFPQEDDKLMEYLRAGYLQRATPALRRNLTRVVCKATLSANFNEMVRWRYTRTARALRSLGPADFETELRQVIQQQQNMLDDEGLWRLISGLCYVDGTWDLLNDAARNRIDEVLRTGPVSDLLTHSLFGPLPPTPLHERVVARLGDAVESADGARVGIGFPDRSLLPALDQLLTDATSYQRAADVLRWFNALADVLTAEDVERLINIGVANGQVNGSVLATRQLRELRNATVGRLGSTQWDEWDRQIAEAFLG